MAMPLISRIIWEDNHLIIINKACGEISQGDKTGDSCMLDDLRELIKTRDAKPGNVFLGLVHRLDRPTSGLMVFAKTSKALERLNETFRGRDVKKTYWAIVEGIVPEGEVELVHWLTRNSAKNKSFASDRPGGDSQEARLRYRCIKAGDRYSLLEIDLLTGRHHQIRAQLGAVGLIIKGDLKYGAARSNADGGICLHSVHICLPHPVRRPLPDGSPATVDLWADPRLVQADRIWEHLMPPDIKFNIEASLPYPG